METSKDFTSTGNFPQSEDRPLEESKKQRRGAIIIAIIAILILSLIIIALYFLLSPNTDANYVARLRDVFIIIIAFESILIGAVLVILILQIARLTNLLQNEIKPILDSTNETVSTLRGTTAFLSDNLTGPVIKLNEYIAGLMKVIEIFKVGKRKL
jgi:uncharacterized integral membrane protein